MYSQAVLSHAMDEALNQAQATGNQGALLRITALMQALKRHREVIDEYLAAYGWDEQAQAYLRRLLDLRLDLDKRIALLGSGVHSQVVTPAFETLCWRALAAGVIWLDQVHLRNTHVSEPRSQIGEHWLRIRGGPAIQIAPQDLASELDQYLFCSLSARSMDERKLSELAHTSATLNRIDRITGMMLHCDGVFLQLIEGPREAVTDLWTRIRRDRRHAGIVLLQQQRHMAQRSCTSWCFQDIDAPTMRGLIHQARLDMSQKPDSPWAEALARMDFYLCRAKWRGELGAVDSGH